MINKDFGTFGKFLKKCRVNADLTQGEVAQVLGYTSAQFISNWERGTCMPPVFILKKLSHLYKIDQKELIDLFIKLTVNKITAEFKQSKVS